MKFTIDKKERYCVIAPEIAKITSINAPEFKTELVLLNKEGFKNIILDLAKVEYVDSSGLSAFIIGNRICNDSNGNFVMCNLQEAISNLVKLAKLDELFTLLPSVEESADYVLLQELERDLR